MSPRLRFAIDTSIAAGRGTLDLFKGGTEVLLKSDNSPVTRADKEAEEFIRAEIEREFPGDSVLGEEMGQTGSATDRWVVDPIDGTKSFIAGVPLYATLLSYECGGVPVLGVCYFPALDELLYAETGLGAFWNGASCQVSTVIDIESSIICFGSTAALERTGRLQGALALGGRALSAKGWGDAYGHALVATGRVGAMVDPAVSHWDISAMSVIVREARGSFTDFEGNEALSTEAISCVPGLKRQILEAFAT